MSQSGRIPTSSLSANSCSLSLPPHFSDLSDLSDAERSEALVSCGLSPLQADAAATVLAALPAIEMRASCEMEGEDEIMEADMAKCKVRRGGRERGGREGGRGRTKANRHLLGYRVGRI